MALHGLLHERKHLGLVADVAADEDGITPVGADCLGRRLAFLGIDVGEHDPGAVAGESLPACETDTLGASGDDGDLVLDRHGANLR